MPLRSVLEEATALARQVIRPGEVAVDATVGNGHDTEMLARFHALSYRFVNQRNDPPRLFVIEKRNAPPTSP